MKARIAIVTVAAVAGMGANLTGIGSESDDAQALSPKRFIVKEFSSNVFHGDKLVFAPRGLRPSKIRSAHVEVRTQNSDAAASRVADIPVTTVRRRARKGRELFVRVPGNTSRGTLVVRQKRTLKLYRDTYGCKLSEISGRHPAGGCWRPFNEDSIFNRELPSRPKLANNSRAVVKKWLSWWDEPHEYDRYAPRFSAGGTGTKYEYGRPIFFSEPDDPIYTVHCKPPWWEGTCDIEGMQVRIPKEANSVGGTDTDQHMAVIDKSTGWEWDFWQVQRKPKGGGTLVVSWGGRGKVDGSSANGIDNGATEAGFALSGGLLRAAEFAQGEINHAIFVEMRCTNGKRVWPSGPNTGRACNEMDEWGETSESNRNAPPLGAQFYLDMSASEIANGPYPEWQKPMLRAMATYGLIVGDTGSFFELESGQSYTKYGWEDPWVTVAKRNNLPSWRDSGTGRKMWLFDMTNIPWAANLKMVAPCVTRGTC